MLEKKICFEISSTRYNTWLVKYPIFFSESLHFEESLQCQSVEGNWTKNYYTQTFKCKVYLLVAHT